MAWADVAVSAGGSTSWELAFMGLPTVQCVLADNQADIAAELHRLNVTVNLGDHSQITPEKIARALSALFPAAEARQAMSTIGRRLVDGRGAARVVTFLRAAQLNVRPAEQKDCEIFWSWANDPEVRTSSFNSELIPWEIHSRWFNEKLSNPFCALFVGFDSNDEVIGQVRFDWAGRVVAEISVSIDPSKRSTGVGAALLRRALDKFLSTSRVMEVEAHIKPTNLASIRAFENAGFEHAGFTIVHGDRAVLMKSYQDV